jgi:hypothetical protein
MKIFSQKDPEVVFFDKTPGKTRAIFWCMIYAIQLLKW